MSKILAALQWALANKAAVLAAVAGLIASASVFIKALEALVAILVRVFPSLTNTDGELQKAAAWLDGLSKSPVLNAVALSPKTAKALLLLFALMLGVTPGLARAAPGDILPPSGSSGGFDWSAGPSLPFLEFDFGNPHPVSVAPGAGVQVSITHDVLKRAFLGKSWDLASLQLSAFGSVISNPSGQQFGALSAAAALCTMSSFACLGIGKHLVSTDQTFTHGGWFLDVSLSFNFSLGPTSPPAGVVSGPRGLARGNTIYWGG